MDQNLYWYIDTDVSGQYGVDKTTSDFNLWPQRKAVK